MLYGIIHVVILKILPEFWICPFKVWVGNTVLLTPTSYAYAKPYPRGTERELETYTLFKM